MRRIVDWYRTHGCKREGKYQVGADWLDQVESIADRWEAISNAFASGKRGCLAVWGPSQSGKSTLLSASIDGECDDGSDSALTWPGGVNARFSPKDAKITADNPGTVILNPFHQGHDASGVPTRYTLRQSVECPSHPVDVVMATRAQVMHAIAAGYLYECDPLDGHGLRRAWDQPQVEGVITDLPDGGKEFSLEAYGILRDGLSCVEGMIKAGESRFSNLDAEGGWKSLRRQVISRAKLVNCPNNADMFIQTILWDNHGSLNDLYRRISNMYRDLTGIWGPKPKIFCSIELAALLLDISALDNAQTQDLASRVNWRRNGNAVLVEVAGSGCPEISADAFGLFQALCGELVVPLNEANIRMDCFRRFMASNDLLDFPGVPQAGEAAEDVLLAPAKLAVGVKEDMRILLTRLFKRGKTISMVAAKAREISIDAFLILSKTTLPVSKPRMINSGLQQWLRGFDNGFAGLSPNSPPPLPIHVNLTFFAQAVANVAMNGASDLVKVATHLDTLGNIALPRNATFHLTNYPHLPPGCIAKDIDIEQVRRTIHSDAKFFARLPGTAECVDAVLDAPDGGTELLFRRLFDIDYRKRADLYRKLAEGDKRELRSLIESQLPSAQEGMSERLRQVVDAAVAALEKGLRAWGKDKRSVIRIANGIKDLCSVPTGIFDELPSKGYETYAVRHFEKWAFDKIAGGGEASRFFAEVLALSDPGECRILLEAMHCSCDVKSLAWHIGDLAAPPPKGRGLKVSELRLVLASFFTNAILHGGAHRLGRHGLSLDMLADQEPEEYDQVPHYRLLVDPFLRRLEAARGAVPPGRSTQPGDHELDTIRTVDFYADAVANLP